MLENPSISAGFHGAPATYAPSATDLPVVARALSPPKAISTTIRLADSPLLESRTYSKSSLSQELRLIKALYLKECPQSTILFSK
jgi:hypothetical protein